MKMNHIRYGTGKPLLLIHGLGGSWKSWIPVLDRLATHREIVAIDLPGHGKTPALKKNTIPAFADAVTRFLHNNNLTGIDAVGSSMGARLVLELARRGNVLGSVVSLNPGGFWQGWQRHFFYNTLAASIRLLRVVRPLIPFLANHAVTRTILLPQFSPAPWRLSPHVASTELQSFVATPVFNEVLYALAYGDEQEGSKKGSIHKPLMIGWGRKDRVCFPSQSRKALALFPDAHVYWFNDCGHFPQWDKPAETSELILRITAEPKVVEEKSIL